ncbi:MAG TPA: hypothetical protein VG755_37120 [Nannocystaceae bacterium]|nr:hypothetical protein [Nannocystaceae bacterium]
MLLLADDGFALRRADTRVWVLTIDGHLTRKTMATSLAMIWAQPEWKQPWGFVVTMQAGATYDGDIRRHEVPPSNRRAVGTAFVSGNLVHRMVVNSIGLGLRLASNFDLSAHELEPDAIARMVREVAKAEAAGRSY